MITVSRSSTSGRKEGERFIDSWEKFKELTMKCPPHGFENETVVQYFYKGLTPSE
jgi:hypothetical protein